MTNIVTPIPIDALPTAPTPADTPQDFDSKAFALLAAMVAMVAQINDTGSKTHQNAIAANERAVSADSSAIAAGGSANAAAQDAARLAALDELWLGAFATDPTNGRNNAPLVAGNAYVNTVTGVVRAYNGSAWVQGVGAVAGVNSLNGEAGALIKTTLAAYGITDIATGAKGAVNLNTVIKSGFYAITTPTNGPAGVTNSQLVVSSDGDTATQIITDKTTGAMFVRGGSGLSGTPVWSAWRRVALHNDIATAISGGIMDCSAGNRFTTTIAANTTLSFSNIPAGAYACVLEINHTGGLITLPAGCVTANGATLDLAAGKRHLLYFEKALLGTPGWYVSTLPNFTP